MQLNVQVEKTSPIARKLTIRVPAAEYSKRLDRSLAEVQRTAKLKGFRPGQAPISVIRQYYGEDVRHRVFHTLIDESYKEAIREQKLQIVGAPRIDTTTHNKGKGEHDHGVADGEDLTFTAIVEILPELDIKGYTGVALTRESIEVKDADVDAVITDALNAQAELQPAAGAAKKGDYIDLAYDGGLVTEKGIEPQDGMKGSQLIEIGSGNFIPGFEDNLIGLKSGESKTFRLPFPKDYHEKTLAGQESEFKVTANEVKVKKLPDLNDEFAKTAGYENLGDFKKKAREQITKERAGEQDRKLRSEAVQHLIEKNPFDVPAALIEAQTRALAEDWAGELKRQGVPEATIQQAIGSEIENLKKRADGQVRASLILEAIAKKEAIDVKPDEFETELKKTATEMQVEVARLVEFYEKNPGRREDYLFRLRQERTMKFLLDKAKIKTK